jgi:hypothetical protein
MMDGRTIWPFLSYVTNREYVILRTVFRIPGSVPEISGETDVHVTR